MKSTKNTYTVSVGNVGCMEYTNKALALDCYTTYVSLSKKGITRAANEPVVLFMNNEIIKEFQPECINE
jgi:hypothetical protein